MITPITKCKTQLPGLNVYVKREDLLPFSFGGNKVRIAQEFYTDMQAKGCNCMIGYGNARSNLSRALASMSASRGIPCHIISPSDDDGARIQTNNSFMVHSCGAVFHECLKTNVADTVDSVMDQCRNDGLKPYYIYGNRYGKGNEAVPVRAYAKVYEEVLMQEKELGTEFNYIFLSTGTGMTQAGLLVGQAIAGRLNQKIVGVSVARSKPQETAILRNYLDAYFSANNMHLNAYPGIKVTDKYLAGGYGNYNKEIINTIKYIFLANSIPLDTTYTGKGFWGMLEYLKRKGIHDANILFVHTGGTPLFFDKIELLE